MSTLDLIGNADNSESDDDDYVPSTEESDASDCDTETGSDVEERLGATTGRTLRKGIVTPRLKGKGGILCDGKEGPAQESVHNVASAKDDAKEQDEGHLAAKKDEAKADLLWSDFLRDVDSVPKKRAAVADPGEASTSAATSQVYSVPEKKVKITQLLDFAGEVVEVDKEEAAGSKETRSLEKQEEDAKATVPVSKKPGGVVSVLDRLINKKRKISTLDESKLDWDSFKQSESIAEDLRNHNRGKDGYLERQAFLQRTDERQFEVEKGLRAKNRSTHRT
ncbi:craniofacial development protein 1-like [Dermacentor andersoni]|uniref:craniofacial development protein 1-like n=1 Tax=Dermacentor andersoni TaxID=34620 RepID=UPI00215572E3|nr:craniofacial development protein 1-like [Dermacentor andersoni]